MKIICDGDSWVFGCEIVNPEISNRYSVNTHPGEYDYIEENDSYRIPRIFPTHLGELFNAEVINLSWPADDNGTILNRTISYITNNFISKNLPTDDLLVIVGWSSPERNFFWYKDSTISHRFRLWPQVEHFDAKPQKNIWDYYVTYLWHPEEYMPRYVMNVVQLQNFLNVHNIKWLCFNSFYQTPQKHIDEWEDLNVAMELKKIKNSMGGFLTQSPNDRVRKFSSFDYSNLWGIVDPIRFYLKDKTNNTFKSFIEKSNISRPFNGWHPSPEGHKIWADELYNYINKNGLFNG